MNTHVYDGPVREFEIVVDTHSREEKNSTHIHKNYLNKDKKEND